MSNQLETVCYNCASEVHQYGIKPTEFQGFFPEAFELAVLCRSFPQHRSYIYFSNVLQYNDKQSILYIIVFVTLLHPASNVQN